MQHIWAPWRAQYIEQGQAQEGRATACFLCRGLEQHDDRANLLVWRRPHSAVYLNRYPYNNGHLLVAPRSHQGQLGDLHGAELLEPIETVQILIGVLDRMFRPDGYNVGLNQGRSAGAGLPGHLHWHIVPRWDGDTNFMPVLGQAKVIIQGLAELYDRLVAELARDGMIDGAAGPGRADRLPDDDAG
ncbi:HIT domain-containing protein [Tautonia sp. JC769]|uniref:HIT family protein n=1 Tax=Tautonia sp. JC769 TaxID=3232135 RepID=UPI00345811C5